MKRLTGVILAGGRSSRMGQEKALLPYNGTTIIENIAEQLKPFCEFVIINTNNPQRYAFLNLPLISDETKDCGPLGGIEAALKAADTDYCFVVPCDLPFFSGRIIPLLMNNIGDADICVPSINGFFEPLVAVYSKKTLPAIQEALLNKKFKVTDAYNTLKVKIIDENTLKENLLENIFVNVNTLIEYNEVLLRK